MKFKGNTALNHPKHTQTSSHQNGSAEIPFQAGVGASPLAFQSET